MSSSTKLGPRSAPSPTPGSFLTSLAWPLETFRSVSRMLLPSRRPLVYSVRVSGTTVRLPSSSSMTSFHMRWLFYPLRLARRQRGDEGVPCGHHPSGVATVERELRAIGRVPPGGIRSDGNVCKANNRAVEQWFQLSFIHFHVDGARHEGRATANVRQSDR